MGKAPIKRYWLRKEGTYEVFQRTKTLAARPDMVPVTEEKAKELQEIKKAKQQAKLQAMRAGEEVDEKVAKDEEKARQIEQGLIPADEDEEPAKAKTVDEMDEEELRAMLKDMKIAVGDDADMEQLRATIKAVSASDGNPKDDSEEPVKLASEDAPRDPLPNETNDAPEINFASMKRNDLAPYCKEAGIPFKGKKVELVAALEAAGAGK